MTQGTTRNSKALTFQELLPKLIAHWSWPTTSNIWNASLRLIEEESTHLDSDPCLKHSKSCYIAYNCKGRVYFRNGDRMTSTDEATYLGASITQTITRRDKIRKNISATMADFKKLDIFCFLVQKVNIYNIKLKLLVYDAAIRQRNPPGLREMFRLHSTNVQRRNTNATTK